MPSIITGDVASGTADSYAPVKIGGRARTSAPTVSANQRIDAAFDTAGRFLDNTYYLRGITSTATATPTRAQEATIMAGNSTNFLDLTTLTAVNTSSVAIQMNIRSGTGGSVIDSIYLAATSSATRNYTPFIPQSEIGQAWTAQNANSGEISDSAVTVSMVAIQNPGV